MAVAECCHTYYGIVFNLGVLVWWLAAAISGFTAIVLFARDGFSEDCRFLASAALFTAILTLDDFLILHENVLPSLGVPQVVIVSVYAPAALAFLWRFRSTIMAADYYVFFAAAGSPRSATRPHRPDGAAPVKHDAA
jgi:hypothetical protein